MTIIKRKSCRAVIISPYSEILLIKIDNPEGSWFGWITPGGGVNENEDEITALQRELYEELGERKLAIGQKVWMRFHSFPWKGDIVEQHEVFYLVHANRFDPKPSMHPDTPELSELKAFRWWTLQELQVTHDDLAPEKLYFYLKELLEKGPPPNIVDVGV